VRIILITLTNIIDKVHATAKRGEPGMEGDKPKPDGSHIKNAGSISVIGKITMSGLFRIIYIA